MEHGIVERIILDVDGVLTDGRKIYNREGEVTAKMFFDRDFTFLKEFTNIGVEVYFLSGDNRVSNGSFLDRYGRYMWSSTETFMKMDVKDRKLAAWELEYPHTNWDTTAYVGDDLADMQMMSKVKFPFCPLSACLDVIHLATRRNPMHGLAVLTREGGKGVVENLWYLMKGHQLLPWR